MTDEVALQVIDELITELQELLDKLETRRADYHREDPDDDGR